MSDNNKRVPQVYWPWKEHDMDTMVKITLALIATSVIMVIVTDVLCYLTGATCPTVSERISYYLTLYPWLGWALAGLAYHLLVRHPAGPLG